MNRAFVAEALIDRAVIFQAYQITLLDEKLSIGDSAINWV